MAIWGNWMFYEIHGCAEHEDEVLVGDGFRGCQEEVGRCKVEDGEGADDRGGGDDGHFCWNNQVDEGSLIKS